MTIEWVNAPAMWYRGTGAWSSSSRKLGDHHTGLFSAVSHSSSNEVRFGALAGSRSGWVYGPSSTASNVQVIAVDVPPLATRHFGARLPLGAMLNGSERAMFAVRDEGWASGVTHLTVTTDVTGVIRIRRGIVTGTVLATSSVGGWMQGGSGRADFWSVDVTIHDSAGACTVYRNGEEVVTFAGDTRNAGVGTVGSIAWYFSSYATSSPSWFLEDLYYGDSSGPAATSALPDLAVGVLDPDGDGDTAEGVPNTGTAVAAVNEAATAGIPDGDTTYVELAASQKHLFAYGNMATAPATIYGVQHDTLWRKSDVGAAVARQVVKSGGAEYAGALVDPGVAYTWREAMRTVNPATGLPWDVAAVNAIQAGVEYP